MDLPDQLREKLKNLPDKPGCYIMPDRKGTIIYVGKAVSLRRRVQSYFRDSTRRTGSPKVRSMVHCVADLEIVTVRNEAEALLTESRLIKQYKPHFNILMRDDKRYPALRADPRDPVPKITACRIIRDDQALYFGPFPSDTVVRTVLDFTEKRYGLRKCRPIIPDAETYRHCINDVVRFCAAPCVNRITPEEYRARFDEACAFLRGERLAVIDEVKADMEKAAAEHDYEMVKQRHHISSTPELHAAEAQAGLRELQTAIGLPELPTWIECFDISNLFGTNSVASMVVAVNGMPDGRYYRRFRIKTVEGADDPRSMAEVVGRRYRRLLEEGKPLPKLLVVDGGITQLRAARRVLEELGIRATLPSVGLAERHEEVVLDDGRPNLLLPRDSAGLYVLTRLRDEAHRFAITYHRRLRNRLIRESALDEIPGIGPARKLQLLKHFGSVARIARATREELEALPGIDAVLASAILRAVAPGDGIQRGAE